jgi:hypothetical protein
MIKKGNTVLSLRIRKLSLIYFRILRKMNDCCCLIVVVDLRAQNCIVRLCYSYPVSLLING